MTQKDYSEIEQRISNDINQFGFHIIFIPENEYLPSFAYTIGLKKNYNHPEIILFGLQQKTSFSILNIIGNKIKNGEIYKQKTNDNDIINHYNVKFIEVKREHYEDYLGWNIWFNDNNYDFTVFQMIWTDSKNRFPWEADFDKNFKFKQPLLDRNVDFKFYEERNLGVYTSQSVLDGKPILEVYHDEDGDWQFLSGEKQELENIKLVSIENLVKMDTSLNRLFSLNYGESAYRKSPQSEWIIK